LEKNPTWIAVVAALVRDQQGRLLLQQALPGKPHHGLWEFPGGKVEDGENPRLALCRELAEELGLKLESSGLTAAAVADEPGREGRPAIVLILYACASWSGEPQSREGQDWGWFTPAVARMLPMPPMDRTLLDAVLARGP
jgi:8-oxo-dGTP diphosphatase